MSQKRPRYLQSVKDIGRTFCCLNLSKYVEIQSVYIKFLECVFVIICYPIAYDVLIHFWKSCSVLLKLKVKTAFTFFNIFKSTNGLLKMYSMYLGNSRKSRWNRFQLRFTWYAGYVREQWWSHINTCTMFGTNWGFVRVLPFNIF